MGGETVGKIGDAFRNGSKSEGEGFLRNCDVEIAPPLRASTTRREGNILYGF